ncbi:coiled-coil domain-containing protein 78 isoform X1 [Hyla sarda]|uniref:coiled-coil domain-containing protein 78 isoform X1 n=1 Tax=Hyla sarda TaxID=327740 RepID=UPI0024C3D7F8|nr:coiled-coil domain-containing protein 78 isoform X1 [Hyla sarda]
MMASADLRDELNCSICLSLYTDPVSLRCGHNFCRSCIILVLDTQDGSGGYSCPDCRAEYPERPALEKNMKLGNIVERFLSTHPDMEEIRIFCTYCDSPAPAVKSCLQCDASFCEKHLSKHNKSSEHILVEPTVTLAERKCFTHKKVLEYYCPIDAACICVSCWVAGDHKGHDVELLDEALKKKKEKLRPVIENLMSKRDELERRVQNLKDHGREQEDKSARLSERVTALFTDLREKLDDLEKRIQDEISRQKDQVSVSVCDLVRQVEIHKDEMTKKMNQLQELYNIPDSLSFLQEDLSSGDISDRSCDVIGDVRDAQCLDEVLVSQMLHRGLGHFTDDLKIKRPFSVMEKSDILLDGNTANNNIIISQDLRSASYTDKSQNRPDGPKRFRSRQVQLQDRNERLYSKLTELQDKMGKLAGSKTDLSSRLVLSEEEKLKISKDLIELQIETNKIREHYEADTFELKNTILALENRLMTVELQKEKLTGEHEALKERFRSVETNRKELADEYIVLKSNYLALSKEHEHEVTKNDELSMELLNLANRDQNDTYTQSRALVNEATAELDRVRAMVNRLSARKIKPEELVASEHERKKLERNLLGNQDEIKEEIESMKKIHNTQQQKLEERVIAMGKELQEAKRAIRNTQHKMAEQSAVLLTSQSQLNEIEAENSCLQMQLKELNEEYRSRLNRYIQDLADYVDGNMRNGTGGKMETSRMKQYVDSMLSDIKASHRSREEQLATATRQYKKRMQNLIKKHENLLIAYRMQREQIMALGSNDVDPGPPEHHFSITDPDLQSQSALELNRLREDKARLESQVQDLKEKRRINDNTISNQQQRSQMSEENWAEIRKQLREFTHNTQEDLEKERSQLLGRAMVAEEQVAELQEYVDKHLGRYKQEIMRLRKLLGNDGQRAFSADTPQSLLIRAPRRISHEM